MRVPTTMRTPPDGGPATGRCQGGRGARLRARASGPKQAPIWPGMMGGWYKLLDERDAARVHAASVDLLEKVGIADPTRAWREPVLAAGGWMSETGGLCFPRGLVEDCLARAGRGFTVRGRERRHDLDVSGTRVHFGGGSATVEILDHRTNRFRETTLLDLYDNTRLEDALDTMHFVIRACIARDVADAEGLDLNTAYAIMSGTPKHFVTSFFQPEHLEKAVAMFDVSLGGDGSGARIRERPFAQAIVTFVVPPLRFAEDACRVLDAAVRNDMPAMLVAAGQAGATAPASLAGALTQGNAEVLAALTAVNLLKPGHPVFTGNWSFVVDLRTGAFVGGGEMALLAVGAAQMARFYDIPSSVASGTSNSKQPDLQAGWEKGYLTALPALAGANLVTQTTGVLADILACSQESFTLDADFLGGVARCTRGFEVTDASLALEVIAEVIEGPGHFLGHRQTLELMESEYYYPRLAGHQSIEDWDAKGRQGLRERAVEPLSEIMRAHYPVHVEPADDARIRRAFDIRLPREDMTAASGRW